MTNHTDPGKDVFLASDITKKIHIGLGNGRGTLILAICGIGMSVSASFIFCLASIGFDFSQLKNIVFWSRWAAMAVISLICYVLVILHKDEKNRMIKWYADNMENIAERSVHIGAHFDEFLRELNMRRRIDWYKRHINAKIAAQNRKLLITEMRQRPTESIKSKIEMLKSRVTDEYIEENKNALKTRSKPISPTQVLSEVKSSVSSEPNFRSAGGYYAGKGTAKVLLSLGMTAAFACVVVQEFGAGITVASVVITILSALTALLSVFSAIMAANGCYRNVYVPNMLFRLKILNDYDEWMRANYPTNTIEIQEKKW